MLGYRSACFYYDEVLFGELYSVPDDSASQIFTLVYFTWGTVIIAGAVGAYAAKLVSSNSDDRRRILRGDDDVQSEINAAIDHPVQKYVHLALWRIGWFQHTDKYRSILASLVWMLLGVAYGLIYEHWPIGESFFFSVSSMAGAGLVAPTCLPGSSDCHLDPIRALCLGTFVIGGIPMFTYTMGNFAGAVALLARVPYISDTRELLSITCATFCARSHRRKGHQTRGAPCNLTTSDRIRI
jgi:hypothetical protein